MVSRRINLSPIKTSFPFMTCPPPPHPHSETIFSDLPLHLLLLSGALDNMLVLGLNTVNTLISFLLGTCFSLLRREHQNFTILFFFCIFMNTYPGAKSLENIYQLKCLKSTFLKNKFIHQKQNNNERATFIKSLISNPENIYRWQAS